MKFARLFAWRRPWLSAFLLKLVLAFFATAISAFAQQNLAFKRVRHLRRGVSLFSWYTEGHELRQSDGGATYLARYVTPQDFRLLHDLGFDHVRLPIDPELLIADPARGTLRPEVLASLDKSVQQIASLGLVVILDIHPRQPWRHQVTLTDEGAQRFQAFWKSFAKHYAVTDPAKVYLEVLNEPELVDPPRWADEQARLIALIRKQAPRHTLIVTGADWASIDALRLLDPLPDANLIYTFHDYEPMEFTHQGATWAMPALSPLRQVPYPSSPSVIASLAARYPEGPVRDSLLEYGIEQWSAVRMQQRIDLAAAWGHHHHVPVWCGEFGVDRDYSISGDRGRWLEDMRTTLERDGIGWAVWSYQDNFGMASREDGVPVMDTGVLHALGLHRQD